jgi:hypothetical protein
MTKLFRFLLSIPKEYCLIKAKEYQDSAYYLFGLFYTDKNSYGYLRGELAQVTANFWKSLADSL